MQASPTLLVLTTRLAQSGGRLAAESVLGKVKAKNIPGRRGGGQGVWTLCSSTPARRWQSQSTLLGPLVRDDRIPGLLTLGQLRTPTSGTGPVSQIHEGAHGDL